MYVTLKYCHVPVGRLRSCFFFLYTVLQKYDLVPGLEIPSKLLTICKSCPKFSRYTYPVVYLTCLHPSRLCFLTSLVGTHMCTHLYQTVIQVLPLSLLFPSHLYWVAGSAKLTPMTDFQSRRSSVSYFCHLLFKLSLFLL